MKLLRVWAIVIAWLAFVFLVAFIDSYVPFANGATYWWRLPYCLSVVVVLFLSLISAIVLINK